MELNNKKELDKIWEDEEKILEYERKATIEATKDKVKLFEKLENYLEANNIDEKLQDIVDWYKDKNRWNGLGLFDLIILKSPSKAVYPLGCIYRIGQYLEEGKYHLENICTRGLKGDELDQHFRTKLEVRIDISDIPLRFRIPSKFRWSIKEHENFVENHESFRLRDPRYKKQGLLETDTEHTDEMFEIVRRYFVDKLKEVNRIQDSVDYSGDPHFHEED